MPQPLEYFGVDRHNSLVAAMQEKWGEGLQHLSDNERLFLLYALAFQTWQNLGDKEALSDSILKVQQMISENKLSHTDNLNLIQALITGVKY